MPRTKPAAATAATTITITITKKYNNKFSFD